jgi:parallel beta helix pectate lyase-like protein
LFAFNASIDSAGSKYYRNSLGIVKLVNTTFSGCQYELLYGLGNFKKNSVIEGCTFKNNRYGAGVNATLTFRNCVFENLSVCAVTDPGGINAKFINCVFKNNKQNFLLRYTANGVTLVDCEVEPGQKPDSITARKFRGTMRLPKLVSKRHIIVKVVDGSGKVVAGAEVSALPEQEVQEAVSAKAKTGSSGLTPGKGAKAALLLAEYCKQAVEGSATPKETAFSYKITVSKAGKTAVISGVKADKNWKQIEVILK